MVQRKRLAGAAGLAGAMAGAVFTAITHAQQAPPGPAAPPTGSGMIAGRALDADSGQGVPGASVSLTFSGPGGAAGRAVSHLFPVVLTDTQGRFVFTSLPEGSYSALMFRDGYALQAPNRNLVLTAGAQITDFNFRLNKFNTVLGTVRDDVGDAVVGTDTYAPTFFPNTPLASRAERVKVEKGETRTSVDITVATVRALRVSGQIVGLPPSGINAASMRLTAVGDVPEAAAITQIPPILVQPDGRFDFSGVPPGTYILDVNTVVGTGAGSPTGSALAFLGARSGPPAPPPPPGPGRGSGPATPDENLWATETIVVGDEDVTGLIVAIQRGVSVRGKVEFAGSASPPTASTMRGSVRLLAMETRPYRPSDYGAQVRPDGTFTFSVPPGRYLIQASPSFVAPWTNTRSIIVKGVDVADAPIVIHGDIPDVVVTMTDVPPPSLMGTVELPAGEIPEEWAVLVFPADKRLWKEPFGSVRRFVAARVSSQRTFTPRLPAGDYLLALSRGIPLDWMEASALEEVSKGATSVTLLDGDKKTVQVKR